MSKLKITGGLLDPIVWWNRLEGWPGGRWLYSKVLSKVVPYTGTIDPYISWVGNGRAVVQMRNTRKVRNHVGTVHAVAMANLVELSASLALLSRPEKFDCVVTGIESKFFKPARGKWICAVCTTEELDLKKKTTASVEVMSDGMPVATGTCTWRIWK